MFLPVKLNLVERTTYKCKGGVMRSDKFTYQFMVVTSLCALLFISFLTV